MLPAAGRRYDAYSGLNDEQGHYASYWLSTYISYGVAWYTIGYDDFYTARASMTTGLSVRCIAE